MVPCKYFRLVQRTNLSFLNASGARWYGTINDKSSAKSFNLLIVGGGSGGIGLASYFSRKLGPGKVGLVEPNEVHTFQPLWTFVGAGLRPLDDSTRPMVDCVHKNCIWLKDSVKLFQPQNNSVFTHSGQQINYDYVVIATGIEPQLDQVEGLEEALKTPGVCSIYDARYAEKVYQTVRTLESGNIIFTFPHTPIKCAGAPQKIMYLTDSNLRKMGKRDKFNICYNTALGTMFSVPQYAKTMLTIASSRDLTVNFFHKLIAVDWSKKLATFKVSEANGKETLKQFKYNMLHVAPPFAAAKQLRDCHQLVTKDGYLQIDPFTLQHVKYENVYGIGDCTNLPTSKTLAAVTAQGKVIRRRLLPKLLNTSSNSNVEYNGYTSCPLITSTRSVVMAEFGYDGKIMETFPFDQNRESRSLFYLVSSAMPAIYWKLHVKGFWEGPSVFRRLFHPFS